MKFKNIIPFDGLDFIKLYSDINVVKQQLKEAGINYVEDIWDNSMCYVECNWHVITIDDSVMLFFSEGNNKLFKISIFNNCTASLPNAIKLGTNINEVLNNDDTLVYDEFEEDYESVNGYWIEENCETRDVYSISIFVHEIDNEDFSECKW